MSTQLKILAIALIFCAFPARAQQAEPDSTAASADSSTAGIAAADSSLILEEGLSAENYLSRRERFSYPRTGRGDPFDFPIGQRAEGEFFGPILSELQLTGVLYTPIGPRIAILSTPDGQSLLLREGDMLGTAEVASILPGSITFRVSEFGQVRETVIELKPLVEEKDEESPEAAGGSDRQQEMLREAFGEEIPAP